MRSLDSNIDGAVLGLKSFSYCFEIILTSGDKLFLTSADKVINSGIIVYRPSSGLRIKEGSFNDSAQDHITIEGIFEKNGVDKTVDLTNAQVKILMFFDNASYHFVTYYCTLYTKYDLYFNIYLEPESIKYNQTVVNVFSKTCRTNFGDSKCKIDKKLFSRSYDIIQMGVRTIEVPKIHEETGYFICGDAHIAGTAFNAKILNSRDNIIYIDRIIPDNLKNIRTVILTAGCDKKFITCCNKFNNAVNFRGEPFIPEHNFLKIN